MLWLARLAFLCVSGGGSGSHWLGGCPLNLPGEQNQVQRGLWWPLASLISHWSQGRGSWALWPEATGSQGTTWSSSRKTEDCHRQSSWPVSWQWRCRKPGVPSPCRVGFGEAAMGNWPSGPKPLSLWSMASAGRETRPPAGMKVSWTRGS